MYILDSTGVSTRANVLIDAYHDPVIIFVIWLPSGNIPLYPSRYFYNVAPTLKFWKRR